MTVVLNMDQGMLQGLSKIFQEPLAAAKVVVPSSPYKVSVKLYLLLFKTPKVEEERIRPVGNIDPLTI